LTGARVNVTIAPPLETLYQPFPMLAGRRAQAWRHQPAYRRPRHFHAEPELNLVARGSAVVGVGDQSIVVSAGELLFFQPGQDHVLFDASDDLDLFVVALRPEFMERSLGSRGRSAVQHARLSTAELSSFRAELSGLADVRDAAVSDERLADLFSLAIDRSPKAHVHSRKALEAFGRAPDASEATLARRLGVHPSGISRHFHGDFGVRLVEYRARLRLIRFVELVDAGASYSRAALDADFGSYAQCHRVFRRLLGCPPGDYFRGERSIVDGATV
jgi:AraC-like DNA-binding protein